MTPQPGGKQHMHSCRILWDGVVVSEESSDAGPVTCRYEKWRTSKAPPPQEQRGESFRRQLE